ncbi:MAG: hypothetical protein H0W58_06120 [Acidobacteria bacterium]|jgi:hypothetical protein|nr:hypothetical protein [Acidobacteriota bacterium]
MQIVAIGKPLFEERGELPEAVEYSYQSGDHTLLLSMKNMHPQEIEAVREAEAEFGLYCENGVMFLLYRFGDALPWSDSAFSWWNVAEEDRRIPAPQSNPAERILLKIILVESVTGIVKAIRVTTLSPDFTEKLHTAIREQAVGDELSRDEFVARSLSIYKNRTPAELAANAIVKTKGGE